MTNPDPARQRDSFMKSSCTAHALMGAALALLLGACGDTTPEQLTEVDCSGRQLVEVDGATYCLVRQEIIEKGFRCPSTFMHFHEFPDDLPGGGGVCSDTQTLDLDDLRRVREQAPEADDTFSCIPAAEVCGDMRDNDCDGDVDCDDTDCTTSALCMPTPPPMEICDNQLDDDGDGDTDCADSDCEAVAICLPPPMEVCDNQLDDDGDGDTDCADPDCAQTLFCPAPMQEVCDNQRDDDNDQLVDCQDPDCARQPGCP